MYVPKHFAIQDQQECIKVIKENPFGILVTQVNDKPFATHLPIVIESLDPLVVTGHLALANPQSGSIRERERALIIFHGAHAYLSPSYYVSSPQVPTWNYVAIHLSGFLEEVDDPAQKQRAIQSMVGQFESSPIDPEYIARLLSGIVVFRMSVEILEGKSKMSQNKSQEDRESIQNHLANSENPMDNLVSRLI